MSRRASTHFLKVKTIKFTMTILSDMDKYEDTGTEKNRSTAKLECPQ